jgi:hypothetical protein
VTILPKSVGLGVEGGILNFQPFGISKKRPLKLACKPCSLAIEPFTTLFLALRTGGFPGFLMKVLFAGVGNHGNAAIYDKGGRHFKFKNS